MKTASKQPAEKALKRLLKRGGKSCYLDLPARFKGQKQGGICIDLLDLLAVIDSRITPAQNIEGIVLFGSATKAYTEYEERLGFLNRKKRTEKQHFAKVRDIDMLVIVNSTADIKNCKTTADTEGWVKEYGYSGTWISRETRHDSLDLFAMTAAEFHERHEAGDDEAKHILDKGVLVLGSFPFVLRGGGKVVWSNRYARYVPREERVMRLGVK